MRPGQNLDRWQQGSAKKFNRFIDTKYRNFLDLSLKYRYITLSSAVVLLVAVGGYGYSDHMGMVLMPEVSADEIESGVSLPVDTTPEQAASVAKNITESTQRMFEKHQLYEVAEEVKTNVRGQNSIDVEIVMRPPDERDISAQELIELWRNQIGDIQGVNQITFEAERGPGGYLLDISVDPSHADIEVPEAASESLMTTMESFEAIRDVSDNYNRGKTQFDFELLPEGRKLGLTPSMVGQQIRNAFYGTLAMRQLRGTNEV